MRALAVCIAMSWWVSALASHSYGGLDLCTLYPEVMPPGMPAQSLPHPESQGAILLQGYCEQCHALPGPGRHTAGEWPAVLDKMNMLMDVASRFGGLMGKVEVPTAAERDVIRAYLLDNALQAMPGVPRGMGAAAFTAHCGSCHALPAPAQHGLAEWPAVLKRMQRNMRIMKYSPPSEELMVHIQVYLRQNAQPAPGVELAGAERVARAPANDGGLNARGIFDNRRWVALGPFLLLMLVGLLRWWQGRLRP